MDFVVYILYSEKHCKTYVGYTSDLISRFKSHNQLSTKGYTIKYRPWKVIHIEFYPDKKSAMAREKYLKTGAGRDYIKTLLPK
ncbi:GIY-YIG nuclease family protein [Flavobacterium sp. RHBU_3]|uniref:GIY-YIG nuclease family protein n=1 Tax=Flavobacterium sp. RHBU_3 TaxID=3391184 RepID=UPI003984E7B7